jgi:hypothetical protein
LEPTCYIISICSIALRRARTACERKWGEGDDHIARDRRGGDHRIRGAAKLELSTLNGNAFDVPVNAEW